MIEGRMTDKEVEEFLGIARCSPADRRKIMAQIKPKTRALYNRMAQLEHEVKLWQDGLGPKPTGVIICMEHRHGKARRRKTQRPARK